jgi:hypothetical protein
MMGWPWAGESRAPSYVRYIRINMIGKERFLRKGLEAA